MIVRHLAFIAGILCLTPGGAIGQPAEVPAQAGGGPADFSLEPVSPNPFEGETRIAFRLGETLLAVDGDVRVSMRIFNILHQLVAVPVALDDDDRPDEPLEDRVYRRPGLFWAYWDGLDHFGRRATAGPYFVELQVGERTQVRKILLVR